jgi:hypothetical protein
VVYEGGGPKPLLGRFAGFDGACLRSTGQVTIEHRGTDDVTTDTATAPALWEPMYFGKNPSPESGSDGSYDVT